eukprot:3889196-Rhodomonas_salina.6
MDVALAIGGHPTHYILISTDSVYMACKLPPRAPHDLAARVREDQAVRPLSAKDKVRCVPTPAYVAMIPTSVSRLWSLGLRQ